MTQTPDKPPAARFWMIVLMGLLTLVFSALSLWQFQRLSWKLDLIARVEARVNAQPVAAPGPAVWPYINATDWEYKRVLLTGHYLAAPDTLTMAVTDFGPGFWVLAPFRTDDGFTIMVNRGFVAETKRAPDQRKAPPATEIQITGLLRISEPAGGFLRSNDPAAERWFSRDVAAIAAARKLDQTAPYFVDADRASEPGPAPLGGLTQIHFRNSHLVYALTWAALAIMSIAAAIYLIRRPNA